METVKNLKKAATGADTKSQFASGHEPQIQQQSHPGLEKHMFPLPVYNKLPTAPGSTSSDAQYQLYKPAGKLVGKKALITGGDSGIGRATAVLFAMEGADVAISYLREEEEDAQETKKIIEGYGSKCFLMPGDLSTREGCRALVDFTVGSDVFDGRIDILVNNCGYQMEVESIDELSEEQWDRTFKTNIYSYFWISKYCIPYMPQGSAIVNNASINHYVGKPNLLDYTSTKGAIIAFTRALSNQLLQAGKGIRVNAVCPGPVWTPLIVSTMTKEDLDAFGKSNPMGRPGQPSEVATCMVFFASADSSFISGSTLHPNGGTPTGA